MIISIIYHKTQQEWRLNLVCRYFNTFTNGVDHTFQKQVELMKTLKPSMTETFTKDFITNDNVRITKDRNDNVLEITKKSPYKN